MLPTMKIPAAAQLYILVFSFALCSNVLAEGWQCAEPLRLEAEKYRLILQETEYSVRDSNAQKPERVEPTSIFDLAAHECHSGKTQAYRIYGPPECEPPQPGQLHKVVYPYMLYYRRAKSEEAMFKEGWKEGADGIWQVTFDLIDGVWKTVGQKELLDLRSGSKHRAR